MKDRRKEIVTESCIVGKIVKIRMTWVGHMVRMKDERLTKRNKEVVWTEDDDSQYRRIARRKRGIRERQMKTKSGEKRLAREREGDR